MRENDLVRPDKTFNVTVQYDLLRAIAQGGMGCVYEALQKGSDGFQKRVAIKIIRQEYSDIPQFRNNFIGEARLVADLIHSNIVQTYHLGYINKQYYMVMEYVHGVNLEQFMLQHLALGREIPCDLAAFIISRLSRALAYAHVHKDWDDKPLGIVHRDVSPKNIMLSYGGDVKLTDFGIAKAFNLMYSKEGEVIAGRSDYLSPEQAQRLVTDLRADIFSCGVVLAEMILGYNPFLGNDAETSRRNICRMPLPHFTKLREDMTEGLQDILVKCLERDRDLRYQTAHSLMVDIEESLYSKGYGVTNEKLATYMDDLYKDGPAYEDDLTELPATLTEFRGNVDSL